MTDTAELIARLRDAEVGYRPHVVGKYLAEAADALSSLVRERDEALTRWKCFHCHQVFTNYHAAQVHFGKASTDDPECLRELGRLGPYLLEKSRALRAAEARATAAEADAARMRALVEQAFRDGIVYGNNVSNADPDIAWQHSRARASLSNTSEGGERG